MALLKLDLDLESLNRLSEMAVTERRPVTLQAEVLLLKALGRWPVPDDPTPADSRTASSGWTNDLASRASHGDLWRGGPGPDGGMELALAPASWATNTKPHPGGQGRSGASG